MSRFTQFLSEVAPVINYRNLPDYLLTGGTFVTVDMVIQALSDIQMHLTGFGDKPSKDVDYDSSKHAKVVIFGKDPTTKQWCVGYTLKNICFSSKEILNSFGGLNAEVLQYALRYLPELHIGGMIQVAILYIKPYVKVGKDDLTFTSPDGIKHIIPKASPSFETIRNSQIGIHILGKYEGSDIRSLTIHPDWVPNIKPSRSIYIMSKMLQDHSGVISMTAAQTQEFRQILENIIKYRNDLTPTFLGQGKTLGLFNAMKEFNSSGQTPTTPNAYIMAFSDWMKHSHASSLVPGDHKNKKIVQNKVTDMINFLNRNQVYYRAFLNLYFTLVKMHDLIAGKIDAIQKLDKNQLVIADRTDGHVKYSQRELYNF